MGQELHALEQIRARRKENAENALYAALREERLCEENVKKAEDTLENYKRDLPGLIDALFKTIMNKKLDKNEVAEVLQKEQVLTAKSSELAAEVEKAKTVLSVARDQTAAAKAALALAERKMMAIHELIKEKRKQQKIADERALGKVLDEFASNRFVTSR